MKFSRTGRTLVAVAALMCAGTGSAQAWTWAGSGNPIVMSGGGGYGKVVASGLTGQTLQSFLRDTKLDDGRVFARLTASRAGGGLVRVDSGQRSDGEASYARMADKTLYLSGGAITARWRLEVKTCRSGGVPGFPPCSDDKRTTSL